MKVKVELQKHKVGSPKWPKGYAKYNRTSNKLKNKIKSWIQCLSVIFADSPFHYMSPTSCPELSVDPWIKGTAVGGLLWTVVERQKHSIPQAVGKFHCASGYISSLLGHREHTINNKKNAHSSRLFKTCLAIFFLLKFSAGKFLHVRRSMKKRDVSYFPVIKYT